MASCDMIVGVQVKRAQLGMKGVYISIRHGVVVGMAVGVGFVLEEQHGENWLFHQ